MLDIQKLRAERAEAAKAVRNVLDNHKETWSPENQAEYDKHMLTVENAGAAISRHERALAAEAAAKFDNASDEQIRDQFGTSKKQTGEFANFIKNGLKGIPQSSISNAQSVGTASEGGYAVATEYQREIIKTMKSFGGVREVARELNTATGARIPFLTGDSTSEVGEQLDENTTAAVGDTVFGSINLDTYVFSSKSIAVSNLLIQDGFIDIEAYITEVLATRIGRITNTKFTTGTGTTTPFGIVAAATSGAVGATGSTLKVTYDKLVDLQHSVNRAYRTMPNVGFMMADLTLAALRKVLDTNGRPIFVPGYEVANNLTAPDTLLGSPIYINDDMAVMAANAKSILYGALSKYCVRNVMDLVMHRMTDSAYTLKNQTGFIGFMRAGGTLLDTAAVKYYQNSAT